MNNYNLDQFVLDTGVSKEIAIWILERQRRCVNCGGTYKLHIHHRVFRSEKELGLQRHLSKALPIYLESYGKELTGWTMHAVQNLVVVCQDCHEGHLIGIHGGNEKLNQQIRWSFTCPKTGINMPFKKFKNLYHESLRGADKT